jgi:hypothetical protein
MSYTQCKLTKPIPSIYDEDVCIGELEQTAWIPTKFAVAGNVLKIYNNDIDMWVDDWIVRRVWQTVDNPPDYRKCIRGHKKRTGDSLPKTPP